MRKNSLLFLCLILCSLATSCRKEYQQNVISLAGEWQFMLDSLDIVESERSYEHPWTETVVLPGSMTENRKGNDITLHTQWTGSFYKEEFLTNNKYAPYRTEGKVKFPFFLQPIKEYSGIAWYKKEVVIPEDWKGKHIRLSLERVHWYSQLWIDGNKIDTVCRTLSTPHRYDLSQQLTPGRHILALKIDNTYHLPVGLDASSITDHTQTNWNGVVGEILLEAFDKIHIEDIQVYPEVTANRARIEVVVQSDKEGEEIEFALTANAGKPLEHQLEKGILFKGRNRFSYYLSFTEKAPLWDEYTPNLIDLRIALQGKEKVYDCRTLSFGMRNIETNGKYFLLNGKRIVFRGTLECCSFPLTGYPPCDVKQWMDIFRTCKEYGLNHMRFHSWCPPQAAFEAADRMGIYLQVECGIWRSAVGHPKGWELTPWLYEESTDIIKEYANHPSFVLLTHGNEPWNWSGEVLREWVVETKKKDNRFLVCAGAHFPTTFDENDYHNPGGFEGYQLRYGAAYENETAAMKRNYDSQMTLHHQPEIAHEAGQWCVFPNLKEMEKYTGVLKPYNMEIVKDFMQTKGMLHWVDTFLLASGKFQAALYKEEIEAFRRTADLGGYQLLGLQDFPGQGTALVGALDVFWDNKGFISAEAYRQFNGEVALLAESPKRVWTNDESLQVNMLVSQYAACNLPDGKVIWQLKTSNGQTVKEGKLHVGNIERAVLTKLGQISVPLSCLGQAEKVTLYATLESTDYSNQWSFWVYPKQTPEIKNDQVILTTQMEETLKALRAGKYVLLVPYQQETEERQSTGNVVFTSDQQTANAETCGTFEPIYWNKLWFSSQRSHTLGIWCRSEHPALQDFPTDFYADWQWQDLLHNSKPIVLDRWPEITPIVQPIDDWNTCRRLGLLFEVKVGTGKLVVCSTDILNGLENRIVARQLRHSLHKYMNSSSFHPIVEWDIEDVRNIFIKE